MNFVNECKKWLVKNFGNKELLGGESRYRGKVYRHEHILKDRKGYAALLLPGVDASVFSEESFKPHRDAHHLNSSQIFCINVFQPIRKNPSLIKDLLVSWGVQLKGNITKAEFEKIVSWAERTNFDFYVCTDIGEQVFFEIKYTESGFGTASKNRHSFYTGWLRDSLHSSKMMPWGLFDRYYQVFRNVSYIKSDNDYVIFLLPFVHKSVLDQTAIVNGWRNVLVVNSMKIAEDAATIPSFTKLGLDKYYEFLAHHYFGWVRKF